MNAVSYSGIQCPQCFYIFMGETKFGLSNVNSPCPRCNFRGSRRGWPSVIAHKILDTIFEHSKHEFLPIILFCTLFEHLTGEFLMNYKQKIKIEGKFISEKHINITKQVELFKTLTGKSFKEAIQKTKLKSFYND